MTRGPGLASGKRLLMALLVGAFVGPTAGWTQAGESPFPEVIPYTARVVGVDGAPLEGTFDVDVRYLDASGAHVLLAEHFSEVVVAVGRFDLRLGTGDVRTGDTAGRYPSLQQLCADHPELELEIDLDGRTFGPSIGLHPAGHSAKSRLVAAGLRAENDDDQHWKHYERRSGVTGIQATVLSEAQAGVRRSRTGDRREGAFEVPMRGPMVSPAVRDLPVITPSAGGADETKAAPSPKEINPLRHETVVDEDGIRYGTRAPKREDPLAVRSATRGPTASTLGLSVAWEGIGNINGVAPPDTEGAVGPNHYIQVVNLSFAVFSKSGTLLAGPSATSSLWAGFGGPCQTSNDGDAIFMYDEAADRWVLAQFAVPTNQERVCFAVSMTPDPTGAYYLYELVTQRFPDYFKLGVWPDSVNNAYFMGTNSGFANQYDVYAIDRAGLLAGSAPKNAQYFQSFVNLLMPADVDGPDAPPAGSPGLFYTFVDGGESYFGSPAADALRVYEFSVDWTTPGNSTFMLAQELTAPDDITDFNWTVCGFFVSGCLPQPSPGLPLDGVDGWPMQRLQYRNFGAYETLVGSWTVDALAAGDHAAPRWFDLRRTSGAWTVHQEGTHAPDDSHRWMGSIAMDAGGNLGLGYSVVNAGASIYPSVRYTGRLASEPVGTLQAEASLVAGTGAETSTSRWGDYSSTEVDPADGCTFWHTNEYIPSNGPFNWKTRIGAFTLGECQLDTYTLYIEPTSVSVCQGGDATFEVAVGRVNGFANLVTLSSSGEPAGAAVGFSSNPVTPPGSSTMTVSGTGAVAPGTYALDVLGIATNPSSPPATLDRSNRVQLIVADGLSAGPSLLQPADGAVDVALAPTFQWSAIAGVDGYTIEIATDAAFTNIVTTAFVSGTSYSTGLVGLTTYFWRVRGENACGIGPVSSAFSFTTAAISCSVVPSTDVPQTISSSGVVSVTSTLDVAQDGTIVDVNVLNLTGTHTWVSDLDFNLISPSSTEVQIFVPSGCGSADDFDIALDDESSNPPNSWPCPPTDGLTYQPNSPLSAFDGESAAGTWTLRVDDNFNLDGGTLDSWSVEICVQAVGCLGPDTLTLERQTVSTTETFEACTSIRAGNGFRVISPGDVTLRAGSRVTLDNGFSVETGSVLRIDVGP